MPPQVNATITAVTTASVAAGGRDDWDAPGVEPGGAGAAKWTGSLPAYYREAVTRTFGNEANVELKRTLWVDTLPLAAVGLDTDDVVTFTLPDGSIAKGRAVLIARARLAGIPSTLQTTRIDLEPA